MSEYHVSIGQVKREISQLLNRVAFGGERILLTSRGKPKAVIVSLKDYEHIQRVETETQLDQWESWLVENRLLTARIMAEQNNAFVDVGAILESNRADMEEHHDYLFSD